MSGYSNVLVPLDFGETAGPVLEAALRVLAPEGVATLLHVVEWMPAVTEVAYGVYAHRKDIDEIKRLARERLDGLAKGHPGRAIRARVKEGRAAPAILEVAAETGAELIVMGTYGRSRLEHLLIGSATERVLRKASCSVLVVRA